MSKKKIDPVAVAAFAMATVERLCWVGTHAVAREYDGKVYGYRCHENPNACVGKSAGGHDFCIIADRWLVDAWAVAVEGTLFHPVVDLHEPNGEEWLVGWYGPREKWRAMKTMSTDEVERLANWQHRHAGIARKKVYA